MLMSLPPHARQGIDVMTKLSYSSGLLIFFLSSISYGFILFLYKISLAFILYPPPPLQEGGEDIQNKAPVK